MKKVIIGIHGLSNKPARKLLAGWWELALREGLGRRRRLPFRMVYWAHHYYAAPLDPGVRDPDDPLFLPEPYVPAKGTPLARGRRKLRKKALQVLERVMDWALVSGRDPFRKYTFEELLLKKRFPELEAYFRNDGNDAFRNAVQEELARTLHRYRRHRVLLIAHSMGSVVAYDVLSSPGAAGVERFVTIGSPLGLPSILKRTVAKRAVKRGIVGLTPETIRAGWTNFSDLRDKVALNYNLADDILPNSRGIVPRDVEVENDYTSPQGPNPHKAYGYLRTAELAALVREFLAADPGIFRRMGRRVRAFFRRFFCRKNR